MTTTTARPPTSPQWDAAVTTGAIRIGAGLALWRWRDTLIRISGGSPDDGVLRALFRYFAVRDVLLGIRTLAATRPGGDVARVIAVQGVADTVDGSVLAGLIATGRLQRGQGFGAVGMAAVTAIAEYAAAWRLRRG